MRVVQEILRLPLASLKFAQDDAAVLASYGSLAFVYRLVVFVGIGLFVAQTYLAVGILLIVWAASTTLLLPAFNALKKTAGNPEFRRQPTRLPLTLTALSLVVLVFLALIPLPYRTMAPVVTWVDETNRLRAPVNGEVIEVLARPGDLVDSGQALLRLEDLELEAQIKRSQAQLAEAQARQQASLERPSDQLILQERIDQLQGEVARYEEMAANQTLLAPATGRWVLPQSEQLVGQRVARGALLGYIKTADRQSLVGLVGEQVVAQLRSNSQKLSVRFSARPGQSYPVSELRITPGATRSAPSAVLTDQGGGDIAMEQDPQTGESQTVESQFRIQAYLTEDDAPTTPLIEEAAWLLIYHSPEPLIYRWWRNVRRLFLNRFDV